MVDFEKIKYNGQKVIFYLLCIGPSQVKAYVEILELVGKFG